MLEYFLLVFLVLGSSPLKTQVEIYGDVDGAQKWQSECKVEEACSVYKVTASEKGEILGVELVPEPNPVSLEIKEAE